MKAVLQRVSQARVVISSQEYSKIGAGILVLAGVEKGDSPEDAVFLARKIVDLRIFEDSSGKMNRSVADVPGEILVVSQFTLLGDCRKGRRPSFDDACPPGEAKVLYERLVEEFRALGVKISTGVFQAAMEIELVNQGPVTLILDSRRRS